MARTIVFDTRCDFDVSHNVEKWGGTIKTVVVEFPSVALAERFIEEVGPGIDVYDPTPDTITITKDGE